MRSAFTKKELALSAIIDYFLDNEGAWEDCIEELDGYNGCLGDDKYWYMEELDELFCNTKPTEILNRAFFGQDEYGDQFNPNRRYFTFNGYGNLVSADDKDYSSFLDECTVEVMAEHRNEVYSINDDIELSALFDALAEAEENVDE